MTPSLVACCPHCGDTATLAVRDDPARLARMRAAAERQPTACGWRYVVVGVEEPETDYTAVIPQVRAGVDRNEGAMLSPQIKTAPGSALRQGASNREPDQPPTAHDRR